ncbi:MAG: DUF5367 family protein [Bacteroidota bacterium]
MTHDILGKRLNVKMAALAALIAYLIGVAAFVGSFFAPILQSPETQANVVLGIAIIPAALLGAHFYYRHTYSTNGFILGAFMFSIIMALDALITVPLFIIPAGGSHFDFFTAPSFWIIGLELILTVALYWRIRMYRTVHNEFTSQTLNGEASNH